MAIQCTPENIQQMMLALQTSFGLDENARKQVSAAHALNGNPVVTRFRVCRLPPSCRVPNSSRDFPKSSSPSFRRRAPGPLYSSDFI